MGRVNTPTDLLRDFLQEPSGSQLLLGGLQASPKVGSLLELLGGFELARAEDSIRSYYEFTLMRRRSFLDDPPIDMPLFLHIGMMSRSMSLAPRFQCPWLYCQRLSCLTA
jgi:hypothetical protein